MRLTMLKCKLHRATVTEANLEYEGSISIDPKLIKAAGFLVNEKVDVLNCNNGARFSTYVIKGGPKEICLNGAAARHVQKGDKVIIVAYASFDAKEAEKHEPIVVFLNDKNEIKETTHKEKNHGKRGV